jgi:hypothetical protein
MAEPTWRERGEKFFERARRGASPDHAVVDGLLAIYCEIRHAADNDTGTAQARRSPAGPVEDHSTA